MGGHFFSSNARREHESASLFDRSPLSAGSSPLPLLLGKTTKKPTTSTRRHAVVRFICSPFTAIFRMKCARACTNDEDDLIHDKAGSVLGVAKRPRLEELLMMEASYSSCSEDKSLQETVSSCQKGHAIVVLGTTSNAQISCSVEKELEPWSLSKSHGAVDANDEREAAIVPVRVDLGVSPTLSPVVPIPGSLRRVLLQALRMGMGRTKNDRYWKLAGSRDSGKAELFYQRPIPMGRRCRVQHLEESPYL